LQDVKTLAEVSKELENHSRMLAAAVNIVQAGELRRKVNELTRRQDELVRRIVAHHPDPGVRQRFDQLSARLEEYPARIKACNDPGELARLKQEIDKTVEEWVHQFQSIVANLMGAPPPPQAISGNPP
jgi:DNA repair exonuclease SbcCD ATPase subunit